MIFEKPSEKWIVLIGSAFLINRAYRAKQFSIALGNSFDNSSLLFLILPAFGCLLLGWRRKQRTTGLIGFLASGILSPILPAIIASIVILYRSTSKPWLVTMALSGTATVLAALPLADYYRSDPIDLTYAAGYGMVLYLSSIISLLFFGLFLVSLSVVFYRFIRIRRSSRDPESQ